MYPPMILLIIYRTEVADKRVKSQLPQKYFNPA
jgi:hypothetical protein